MDLGLRVGSPYGAGSGLVSGPESGRGPGSGSKNNALPADCSILTRTLKKLYVFCTFH